MENQIIQNFQKSLKNGQLFKTSAKLNWGIDDAIHKNCEIILGISKAENNNKNQDKQILP